MNHPSTLHSSVIHIIYSHMKADDPDAAINILVDDAYAQLYKWFTLKLDEFTSEELANETMFKVFIALKKKSLPDRQEPLIFRRWFWTVARNTLTDHFRKTKNKITSLNDLNYKKDTSYSSVIYKIITTGGVHRKSFVKTAVLDSMRKLDELSLEIIKMHSIEEFSFREIAEELIERGLIESITHTTVRTKYANAIKKVKNDVNKK